MQVSEMMSRDVQMTAPSENLLTAARTMAQFDVGALPVGEQGRLIGMVTDRDIVVRGLGAGRDPTATTVREVMSAKLNYCFEDEDAALAAESMSQLQIRRLPVLDRSKRLVGIVSLSDIARHAGILISGTALRSISDAQPEEAAAAKARAGASPSAHEPRGIQKGIADADKMARTGSTQEAVRDTPPAGAWNETSGD